MTTTPDYGAHGKTLLAEDGLRHIIKMNGEWNRGFNGWAYHFECGDDVAYMTRGTLTDDPPTCLTCIDRHGLGVPRER